MGCFVTWYHPGQSPSGLSTGGFPAQSSLSGAKSYPISQFMQIRLLEINFEVIIFNHILRNQNSLADAYANYILDWHLTHIL